MQGLLDQYTLAGDKKGLDVVFRMIGYFSNHVKDLIYNYNSETLGGDKRGDRLIQQLRRFLTNLSLPLYNPTLQITLSTHNKLTTTKSHHQNKHSRPFHLLHISYSIASNSNCFLDHPSSSLTFLLYDHQPPSTPSSPPRLYDHHLHCNRPTPAITASTVDIRNLPQRRRFGWMWGLFGSKTL